MSEAVEREELAQIVYLSTYPDPASTGIQPLAERAKWEQDSHCGAADAILTAGYRKTRTVATAEELDALLDGSAIRDSSGDVGQKLSGRWYFPETASMGSSKVAKYGPATVIWDAAA